MLLDAWGQEQKPIRRLADEHYMRYEFARAAVLYNDIAKRKKSRVSPEVLERLADSYRRSNRYELASEWYAKVVANPNAAPVNWLYYGDMLKSLGRYDEAKTQYQQYAQKSGSQDTVQERIAGCDSAKLWLASPTNHQLENMAPLNSGYADWGGVYARNNSILFTSDTLRRKDLHDESKLNKDHYGWTLQDYGRLYAADTLKNGEIRVRDLSHILNRYKYHVGPLAFTKSYDTVVFTVTDPDKTVIEKIKHWPVYGTRRLVMYRAIRKNNAWQTAKPFPYNKPDQYSVGHAAYNLDNSILYFASDMPGGKGGTDIWYCERQPGGELGPPQNCGDGINTAEDELFPTIDESGNLYFASKGHAGMGGFDIFMTQGEKSSWKAPENLHSPRNSSGDDFYYVTRGDRAVLSSNRIGGKGDDDIYTMQVEPPLQPGIVPVPLLQIKLEGNVCPNFVSSCIYLYNKQRNIGWCFMPASGQFTAMLEAETDYVIRVYAGGALRESIEFSTRGVQGSTTIEKSICPGQK